jgi:hypothetical protein
VVSWKVFHDNFVVNGESTSLGLLNGFFCLRRRADCTAPVHHLFPKGLILIEKSLEMGLLRRDPLPSCPLAPLNVISALQMATNGGRPEAPRIAHAHTVGPDWPSEPSLEGPPPKSAALPRATTFSGALRGRLPSSEGVLQQPLLRPIRTGRASDGATSSTHGMGAPSGGQPSGGVGLGGVSSPVKRTSLSRQGSVEVEECRICKEGREGGERMIRCGPQLPPYAGRF